MATENMLILNWSKQTETSPWSLRIQSDEGKIHNVTVGTGGMTAAGPRLQSLMQYMEITNTYYPLTFSMHHIGKRSEREIRAQQLNGKITFIETTERTVTSVRVHFRPTPYAPAEESIDTFTTEHAVSFQQPWQIQIADAPSVSAQTGDYSEKNTYILNERPTNGDVFWVFMDTRDVAAQDGGTITGYVDGFYWPEGEEVPAKIGNQVLDIQQVDVEVDYLGVTAFGLTSNENRDKAKYYHLNPSDLAAAGVEAYNYNKKLIEDSKYLAISLQYTTDGLRPVPSRNNRLSGTVYATQYTSFSDIESALAAGSFKGININKSLLKEHYSYGGALKDRIPESVRLPLVEFNGHDRERPTNGLKIASWSRELSLAEPPNEKTYMESKKAVENMTKTSVDKMEDVFEKVVDSMDKAQTLGKQEIKARDFVNNDLAFVPPKDDRIETGELYMNTKETEDDDDITEDLPYDYKHRVRLGDSIFSVPPLSIRVDKQHRNEKVQGMRSQSSMQKQVGYVQNVLTMDLYFHDLENINGQRVHAYTRYDGEQVFYYMDGLRSLLAQFKRTPFLPIDNEYVNTSLNIKNVALVSVSAQTVENFPEALQVTLVLEEVDVAVYMMGTESLGEKLNYPLMRWYYQQALQEPGTNEEWKTYLPTIDHLDNNFSFRIVNEYALEQRTDLLKEFRQLKVPARLREELKDEERNEDAYKMFDAGFAKKALEQYTRFMAAYSGGVNTPDLKIGKDIKELYKTPHEVPVMPSNYWDSYTEDFIYDTNPDIANLKYGKEVARHIYGTSMANTYISNHPEPLFEQETEGGFFTLNTAIEDGRFAKNMGEHSAVHQAVIDLVREHDLPGFFILRVRDRDHQRIFAQLEEDYQKAFGMRLHKEHLRYAEDGRKDEVYLFPAGNIEGVEFMSTLRRISKSSDSIEERIDEYTFRYNAMAAEINRSEENMLMDDFPIDDLIPLSMNVSLHNNFSSVQPQAAEVPAKQFLGAQDPEIVITFETDEWGINRIDEMMRKVAGYAKKYRDGIVSGFIDIQNPLANLFGIQSVLPETVQFSTVPGHPERKIVTLGLVGFNKTQRRQEALYGFSGAPRSSELREIAFGNKNYDPNLTPLFTHEKIRHMELYPDLELPTIDHLNEELRFIGAGFDQWENRTNQIYLDPDFYVSTSGTYRKYIKDVLDSTDGPTFRWEDDLGLSMETTIKQGKPLVMSEEDRARYDEIEKNTDYIDPETEWEGWEEDGVDTLLKKKEKEIQGDTPSYVADPPKTFENSAVENYVNNNNWRNPPQFSEWKNIGIGDNEDEYRNFINGKQPSDEEIWKELANAVRKHFGDSLIPAVNEYRAIDSGELPDSVEEYYTAGGGRPLGDYYTGEAGPGPGSDQYKLDERTWADRYAFYWEEYPQQTSAWSDDKDLENGTEDDIREKTGMDGILGKISDSAKMSSVKMPFMRVLVHLKAAMSLDSKWQTLTSEKTPVVSQRRHDGNPWRVGIMGADLNKASSEDEAKRLLWDWKYNIDFSVKKMAEVYKQAEASDYREIRIRRLDWAIASHSGDKLPSIIASNDEDDDKPFTSGKDISPDEYNYFLAVESEFNKHASRSTEKYPGGIYTNQDLEYIPEIFSLYQGEKWTSEENMEDMADELGIITGRSTLDWTNEQKLKGMYIDMYHYDQTGRMLRAFPSFSLQLIDEGKWYRNFRTWDNFYAYNALNTIDVYKSRKIAADTAVITMSNMYGGLTGMRHDMKHFDFRMPSFFSAQFWSHYVWGSPTKDILDERAQIYETIMLEPGARMQLRMGYGADAHSLPIVFNGTITEVNADDIVQITAQSDALELTNAIGGSPKDKNKRWLQIEEPSEYIGRLMTTKGNWIRDLISGASDGTFFKESPMGVAHFGASTEALPENWLPFTRGEYSETLQNVYAQSSSPNSPARKHAWANADGTEIGAMTNMIDRVAEAVPTQPLRSETDEDNILLPVFGMTIWEIVQTFALCSMDYVTQVLPFEYRSTLFFGRPHWPMTYAYDSNFVYDEATKEVRREITYEHQKTFMQAHIYSSQYNILSNNIETSEKGVYNNVIVEYDGRTVGPIQADNDIRFDRQKTALIQGQIMAKGGGKLFNYWTSEKQAQVYGMSTLRDFMKDMYKGNYTVLGDATVKPHDINYLGDTVLDMQGIHLVKAVHHSMSVETGFISTIEPDAYVVNFDQELIFLPDKVFTVGKNTLVRSIGVGVGATALGYSFGAPVMAKLAGALWNQKTVVMGRGATLKLKEGLGRHILSNQYSALGKSIGDDFLISEARRLKSAKKKTEAIKIMDNIQSYRGKIIQDATAKYKGQAFRMKLAGQYDDAAQAINGIKAQNYATKKALLNKANIYASWADDADELTRITRLYRQGKMSEYFAKGSTLAKTKLTSMGLATKTLLASPLFWMVAVTVVMEVATAGLVEMWSRKKQNAEAIKVIPLEYKGRSMTAAMNGRRGAVVGDDPSMGDRILNGTFGGGDDEVDKIWWSFIPKLLNSVSDD